MRKKILIGGISLLSLTSYSILEGNNLSEINNSFVREKGREYIRQGIMSDFLNREGSSKSNQYIEGFLGNGKYKGNKEYSRYNSSSEGIVIGTTSQFNQKENSSWITGVSFGYVKSDVDYKISDREDKVESVGTNAYLGYRENNLLAFSYLGLGINKNKGGSSSQNRKSLSFGGEVGKVYSFSQRKYLYPYLGVDYSVYFLDDEQRGVMKYEEDRYSYGNGAIGVSYFIDYTKWQIKFNIRANTELFSGGNGKVKDVSTPGKSYDSFKLDGENLTASFRLGYYLAEDILLTFETLGVYNKEARDTVYGLRISHNF